MSGGGGGGGVPPVSGGEFLLQLLRRPPNSHPTPSAPQTFPNDPAVAALGPSIPIILPSHAFQSNNCEFPFNPWSLSSSPPFAPHSYFQQNSNSNPDFSSPPGGFSYASQQFNLQSILNSPSNETRNLGFFGDASKPSLAHRQEPNLIFGSVSRDVLQNDTGNISHDSLGQSNKFGSSHRGDNLGKDPRLNGLHLDSVKIEEKARGSSNNRGYQAQNGNYRVVTPPPGFASKINVVGERYGNGRTVDDNVDKGKGNLFNLDNNNRSSNPVDSAGTRSGHVLHSVLAVDTKESMSELHYGDGDNGRELRDGRSNKITEDGGGSELDDLADQLVDSVGIQDESGQKNEQKKHHRDKDYRSDKRGQWIMGQRMRNQKSFTACRTDINRHNAPFLALFESLIPADEEKIKQKQLLTALEKLVCKEWPEARLYLYGSCANSFGFSKSDIDVCLAMELEDVDKSEVLLKLADIFVSENLQNVQALTRARVPIVKLMDPVTGISCDICINNVLAVVNTKLLRDYAKIDARLRQLVFLVKHWAKSRGVNETYQGTLSSYAYVLMCIHFLQQRRPAILPCLQGMKATYYSTVDTVECAYFDEVEKLHNYGSQNKESIAQLVWGFFHYWAYCHDYANDVISVRTGHTISKRTKDWTRRVGNDRHLICIEDPFEVSHDLGRVVDKFSIRVLREEFERAAHIMQQDPNPSVTLFQPYIPD